MILRPVAAADFARVRTVTEAAFGRPDEAGMIEAVRAENRVLVEIVADAECGIVGHILFSRLSAEPAALIAGLAPLSVTPARQRRGFGAALARRGLEECRALGAVGCVLLGSPAYYGRFRFARAPANIECRFAPLDAFQALAFGPNAFARPIRLAYPAAFD